MVHIRDHDFQFIRQLVYDQSSIHLGEEKKDMVCTRLNGRLSQLGLATVEEYCERLKTHDDPAEITHLIDALSTNFTTFFREIEHFKFLKSTVIPDFEDGRMPEADGPLRAWSAACSTGEEPYSMAVVLASCLRTIDPGAWTIFASDISTRVLEKASRGIYESNRVKVPNSAWVPRYFQKGEGAWDGYYRVKKHLRDQIHFEHQNLLDATARRSERYHVIFCRNVMIYFDHATAGLLIDRLCQQLHEGGYLIIGHAESLTRKTPALAQIKPSIFRRTGRHA